MAYTREQTLDEEFGNELKRKIEERGLTKKDLEAIAENLSVTYPFLRDKLHFWKDGFVFGTPSLAPQKPGEKLEMLAYFIRYLGFEEDHPAVQRLYKKEIGFEYKSKEE